MQVSEEASATGQRANTVIVSTRAVTGSLESLHGTLVEVVGKARKDTA